MPEQQQITPNSPYFIYTTINKPKINQISIFSKFLFLCRNSFLQIYNSTELKLLKEFKFNANIIKLVCKNNLIILFFDNFTFILYEIKEEDNLELVILTRLNLETKFGTKKREDEIEILLEKETEEIFIIFCCFHEIYKVLHFDKNKIWKEKIVYLSQNFSKIYLNKGNVYFVSEDKTVSYKITKDFEFEVSKEFNNQEIIHFSKNYFLVKEKEVVDFCDFKSFNKIYSEKLKNLKKVASFEDLFVFLFDSSLCLIDFKNGKFRSKKVINNAFPTEISDLLLMSDSLLVYTETLTGNLILAKINNSDSSIETLNTLQVVNNLVDFLTPSSHSSSLITTSLNGIKILNKNKLIEISTEIDLQQTIVKSMFLINSYYLYVNFLMQEGRIVNLSDFEVVDYEKCVFNRNVLFIAEFKGCLVQVCEDGIYFDGSIVCNLDISNSSELFGNKLIVSSLNKVVCLEIAENHSKLELKQVFSKEFEAEVSCIYLTDEIFNVCLWNFNVEIYSLSNFNNKLYSANLNKIARCCIVCADLVFIGLGNGEIVEINYKQNTQKFKRTSNQSINQFLLLKENIFISCSGDFSTLVLCEHNRVKYFGLEYCRDGVNSSCITSCCKVSSKDDRVELLFSDSERNYFGGLDLDFGSEFFVKDFLLNEDNKVMSRRLSLFEDKYYGILCEKEFIVVLDEISVNVVFRFKFDKDEVGLSLNAVGKFFVVGTGYEDESQPSKGRLLVFSKNTNDNSNNEVFKLEKVMVVRGGVFTLSAVNNYLFVAGVNAAFALYSVFRSVEDGVNGEVALKQLDIYKGGILCLHSAVINKIDDERNTFHVLMGDVMRSISLLEVDVVGNKFKLVGVDPKPSWVSAVGFLSLENEIYCVLADSKSKSIYIYKAPDNNDYKELEMVGRIKVGIQVNKFRNVKPHCLMFVSSCGVVGFVQMIRNEKFEVLESEENRLNEVDGLGGLEHQSGIRVVDGDFLKFGMEEGSQKDLLLQILEEVES